MTMDNDPTPARPTGFLTELQLGRLRWDLISPFPAPDPEEQLRGDRAVADLMGLLREQVDPTEVDRTERLPEGYHEALTARGYFKLMDPPARGGLGLSSHSAFRVIQAAAAWSVPACYAMAVHLGLGAGVYLPLLTDDLAADLGALLDTGAISGDADTEPTGAINRTRATSAVPTEDGTGYLISGEKIFIQNGPIARLLRVSATVRENGEEYIRLFFVDTEAPGFTVKSWHEYLGLKGLPNAALTLDRVFVPRSRMFTGRQGWTSDEEWRLSPELNAISAHGRMFPISAPALAIAKLALHWQREFVRRRTAHGRALDDFDEVQRIVAGTAAEVFALEAVTDWCLLAAERHPGVDVVPEQTAAKNITSLTCWSIVDRTVSLLAGEGFETARSKARRGAEPLPLERFFRDARALRIAGGVDFMVDHYIARGALLAHYDAPDASTAAGTDAPPLPDEERLSERNRAHLHAIAEHADRFACVCRELTKHHPDREELFEQERTLILLGRITSELFTMTAALARAARLGGDAQHLADIFCDGARHRITDAWARLDADGEADHAAACAAWLHGERLEFLVDGVTTVTPPVTLDEESC
ncbi:acyl-CoA dehydrogenase family protein [Streptomyces sp. AGS-58]|uniref:acyl-CoA dehydrogenase family protein n=1 Tax=unclassified Streptomyces TaxID=2593676 RepID=UPI0035A395C8